MFARINITRILIVTSLLLAIVSFLLFFIKFHGASLSSNLDDWSDFATFFSLIVSIENLIVFILLTIKASTFNKESLNRQLKSEEISLLTNIRQNSISELNAILNFDFLVIDNRNTDLFNKVKPNIERTRRNFETFRVKNELYFKDEKIKNKINDIQRMLREVNNLGKEKLFNFQRFNDLCADLRYNSSTLIVLLSKFAFEQINVEYTNPFNVILNINDDIRVGVGALIFNSENKVLLLNRKKDPEKNHWSIPGGKVEYGEKVEDAILREVKEETGLDCEIEKFIGYTNHILHDVTPCHWIALSFKLSNSTSNEPKNLDTEAHSDIQWFPLDKLPDKLTIPTKKALLDYTKIR